MKKKQEELFISEEDAFESWGLLMNMVRDNKIPGIDKGYIIEATTFDEAIRRCGWPVKRDVDGNVISIEVSDGYEPIWDILSLFMTRK